MGNIPRGSNNGWQYRKWGFWYFVFGHISRDVYKKLPYFKVHSKKLGRKGEMNKVAVKLLKGGCSIFFFFFFPLFSIPLCFNDSANVVAH